MKKKTYKIKIPQDQRIGQAIFNFLEYSKHKGLNYHQSIRMGDPFYLSNEDFKNLWNNWLSQYEKNKKES